MSKKKRTPPPKKSNLTMIYVGLVVFIAVLVLYYSAVPEKSAEKLPTSGEYVKLNMPTTYEPGKVKIVEFLKFDCSHCYALHTNMPQLLKRYGDHITITYVPIAWQGQSTRSIEAYIIAEQVGKGEEMRDALFKAKFEKGLEVMESEVALEDVAASIGLGAEFREKLERSDAKKAALENLKLMQEYNVQGTPAVVINGNLLVNPSISNIDAVISSLLS